MKPRSPLRRLPAVVVAVIVAGMVALAAGCSSDDGGFVSEDGALSSDQREQIETFIGSGIPETAVADETRAEMIRGGPDDAVRLRLTLPPADVQPFLDRVGFDEPLRDAYRGVSDGGGGPDWFRTGDLAGFRGAKSEGEKSLQVTVDVSDPQRSVVYLLVFET